MQGKHTIFDTRRAVNDDDRDLKPADGITAPATERGIFQVTSFLAERGENVPPTPLHKKASYP
jgi:hypothetical protein